MVSNYNKHSTSILPRVDIFIEPNGDPGPVLEVAEDEVDGLDHHLLNLLAASVAHLISQVGASERGTNSGHFIFLRVSV